jgi:biotin transport system substrate-specific component
MQLIPLQNSKMNDINQPAMKKMKQRNRVIDLVVTGMFTAIICVMAQISLPVQPIPFTLALLSIFLTGALLPPRYALLSVISYLLLGGFGLPVFAGLKGGIQVLAGMTGGYLMAYPVMAFVTALFYKYIKKHKTFALTLGMLVSLALCYMIGTLWFCFVTGTGFITAFSICVVPYLTFDLLKIVLAVSFSSVIKKTVMNRLWNN